MINPVRMEVLAFAEIYQMLFTTVVSFMNQGIFANFMKLMALFGIVMGTFGYLKRRDPTIYVKWVVSYVLVLQLVMIPKTEVMIEEIADQKVLMVKNVPLIFAVGVSIFTQVGVGIAESYDKLLSIPEDFKYTQKGMLMGSKIIQSMRSVQILEPLLKQEMNDYFKNCVLGDIELNHKYSFDDLIQSSDITNLIMQKPSPIRFTTLEEEQRSCQDASQTLKEKLNKANRFFDITLHHHLQAVFHYFQGMTDDSAHLFLQTMMIHAMEEGLKSFQASTDSSAVLMNAVKAPFYEQSDGWSMMGEKLTLFLPIIQSVLQMMLLAIFPIIMVITTLPGGGRIFRSYFCLFITLQFWPVMFAILNSLMTVYANYQSIKLGAWTMSSIDRITGLHSHLLAMTGYLMLISIFFIQKLVFSVPDQFSQKN